MQKWIILGVVVLIVIIGITIVLNVDIETEYIPESEIEEEELRKTIVSLYFREKDSGEIVKETRLIDSKDLLKDPYGKLVNMLLEGPQNGNLENVFPDNVNIIDSKYENGSVIINFNSEFLNVQKPDSIVESIEKTLKELTEVTNIKILVEGNNINENETTQNVANIENTSIIE